MWKIEVGEVIRSGKVQAEMMGGCLSVLVTTLGTPYEIDTAGKMLFLEDVGEKPYRVERMLTHLKLAGKLEKLAGLVFGDFTQCEGEGPRDVRAIIGELFHEAPYPVVMGIPAGTRARKSRIALWRQDGTGCRRGDLVSDRDAGGVMDKLLCGS